MKTKKSRLLIILFTVFFIVIYLFLAVKPIPDEYQFNPEWRISVSSPLIQKDSDNKSIYFKLGQSIGYFDKNGKINNIVSYPSKSSISNSYYCTYNVDAHNTPFYKPDGSKAGIIHEYGFPFFNDDRIYVFLPGGTSLSKCNSEGENKWTYEGVIPITAFNSNLYSTIIGFADGTINVINNETGKTKTSYNPGGSDFPVVLGLDISNDNQYSASISGHNKQRFVLFSDENNQQKIIFHTFLDSNVISRTFVQFTDDNKLVLYNYGNKLGIYDLVNKKNKSFDINTSIISMKELENIIVLLGKKEDVYSIYFFEKSTILIGHFDFKADNAFIQTEDNMIFVGKDNSISKINVSRG